MAPSHRYDLIKNSDDVRDDADDIKDEPQESRPRAGMPAWWKVLFYMLLAASAGFGAAFGVVFASSMINNSDSVAAAATASPTLSPELAIPSVVDPEDDGIDDLEEDVDEEGDPLVGRILECGYSPEEARAAGCVYDVMMQDWVPEPCYDPVLTERYLASGNYTWYKDFEGHVMSDEEMAKGEHREAWMTGDYHKAHCIFSWEKLIRALRNKEGISQELLSYDHVLHCRMQTLGMDMSKRDEGIAVRAPTNYARCAKYGTWKNDLVPDKHSSVDK